MSLTETIRQQLDIERSIKTGTGNIELKSYAKSTSNKNNKSKPSCV